ncbi:MAG: HD domain-containing protein [Isosphaeraceae bacterium]
MSLSESEIVAIDEAIHQTYRLKSLKRTGWVRRGLAATESVADHCFQTLVLALLLGHTRALDPSLDLNRLLQLLIVHDLAESDPDVGDITPHCGVSKEEKTRREARAIERWSHHLPGGGTLRELWDEYEQGESREARIAREIDALEMGLQAAEYASSQNADLTEFLESARGRIHDPVLKRLLEPSEGPRAEPAAREAGPGGRKV